MEQNSKGKLAPRKVGLAPVQRDGMEYEFTTVFDIAMDHHAAVSKDRTELFDDQIFKITVKTGETLKKWLDSGVDMPKPVADVPEPAVDVKSEKPRPKQQTFGGYVKAEMKRLGKDAKWLTATMNLKYGTEKAKDMTPDQRKEFINYLKSLPVEEVT